MISFCFYAVMIRVLAMGGRFCAVGIAATAKKLVVAARRLVVVAKKLVATARKLVVAAKKRRTRCGERMRLRYEKTNCWLFLAVSPYFL